MDIGSSYDEGGPLCPMGAMSFSAATGLPGGRQSFDLEVYMVASDEAQVVVEYNGLRLCDFGTWNDYYGFGTSPETALYEAQDKLDALKGINADVSVIVTLQQRPCFPARDEPFYAGSQRVHFIPYSWRSENTKVKETSQDYVVWKNGQRTPEALSFYDEVMRLASADAAPSRNSAIRTVGARKNATTRDLFLKPKTQTT